uniref:Peptidylglycine alpha-amidating monooxygenase n=1 Tax=Astatotilapia calliptera TaxID=8154 RepID=A0AAX7SHX3_ASTCA
MSLFSLIFQSDTYLCMAFPVPTRQDAYIVDFIPLASMDTVHHMLLFGCQTPVSTNSFCVQGTCEDEAAIMYAWARNAPPTKLPKDVGFKVGRSSGMSYFVLQIHYGDISAFKGEQPFIAGIYLLMSVDTVILPGQRVTDADVACDYTSYPIYPFAFRTHTHRLGKVVSGYRIRDGKWTLIGRQSPQLPQAFYPANKQVTVKYGDTLAARCVFTGEGKTSKTYIGGTSDDEMCNFYIMYYMESRHAIPYMNCMEMGSEELFQHIPPEANVPINVSPSHMNSVMHLGQSTGTATSNIVHLMFYKLLADLLLMLIFYWMASVQFNSVIYFKAITVQQITVSLPQFQVSAWPQSSLQLGQVSGLALDSDSNLVIFHRGDHHWGADSFNNQARYQQRSLGPIQQSAILVVDPSKGSILKASGRNMFFLPHGITADKENNYWVTDVALHQVSFSSDGKDKTLMALGEAFIPGSDNNHFCQPTDVAVDTESGNIFVSDGYCNARIIKFSADGKYLSEWGADRRRRIPFHIPHSLVLLPDKKEICVADRENGRIQCFIAETGEFVKEIKKDEFGGEVFAISYNGLIFAVNGESLSRPVPIRGFVIDYSTKDILDTFSPNKKEFKMPHDIAETRDGSVFVGDASSKSVYKFTTEKLHHSVKKAGIEVQELEEMDAVVQTKVKQDTSKTAAIQEKQTLNKGERVLPVIITTLLLIPLVVVISIGVFISWRKKSKAVGSLNLGNFFPSHKGYSRQGFDQLSTEGSDQERNDEDSSDSENEEYSALPPPQSSS